MKHWVFTKIHSNAASFHKRITAAQSKPVFQFWAAAPKQPSEKHPTEPSMRDVDHITRMFRTTQRYTGRSGTCFHSRGELFICRSGKSSCKARRKKANRKRSPRTQKKLRLWCGILGWAYRGHPDHKEVKAKTDCQHFDGVCLELRISRVGSNPSSNPSALYPEAFMKPHLPETPWKKPAVDQSVRLIRLNYEGPKGGFTNTTTYLFL